MKVIVLFCFIFWILMKSNVSFAREKIVGGQIADPHSFPYQVAILVKTKSKTITLCGGSIVDMKVVLTAGHCLKNADGGVIIIGTNDLLSNETDVVRHYVDSSSFKVHPQFNIHVAYLDVALIFLPEPLKFSNAIQSVKLPSGYLLDESFAGEIGTVSGYGQYCDTCGSSNLLRFTQNRVMQNIECGKSFEIGLIPSENHVCLSTVETNSGNCRGDSGGPLTIFRSNKTIQIGLSSFGSKNCEKGSPTVFTRLTREIVSWINEEIETTKL